MNASHPGMKNEKSKMDWKFILTITVFLLGSGIIWKIIDIANEKREPHFTVSAINTLGGENPNIYEITNHFIGAAPSQAITVTWGIEVIPDYSGSRSYGEVRVLVKNAQDIVIAEGRWDNLDSDSKPLLITLDPYQLSNEVERIVGFKENVFETENFEVPEGTFNIEIVQSSRLSSPLEIDKLTIRNTPWYHYTTVSNYGNSVNVFFYGKNLGEPSSFVIVSEIFEIAELPGRPWVNWPWVDYQQVIVTDVGTDEGFTDTLTFPHRDNFQFEKGKIYYINTYLVKEQNYVQFSDGSWELTQHKWRFGNLGSEYFINP